MLGLPKRRIGKQKLANAFAYLFNKPEQKLCESEVASQLLVLFNFEHFMHEKPSAETGAPQKKGTFRLKYERHKTGP